MQVEKKVKKEIGDFLLNKKINTQIESRFKTIYSLHQKITKKNILFSQVLDVIGLRILVETDADCYRTMEGLILKWVIIKNKIKDYIAVPKSNGYQSIHLTIMYEDHPVEIQIRTYKMHWESLYGESAHGAYKEEQDEVDDIYC